MGRLREQFGEPKDIVVKKMFPHLNSMVQDFIREAPFVVLATSNGEGACDASPKGGTPGFVKVLDEKHLLLPDIAGNKLFQSYENVEANPRAGLLFLIPGCEWTVRVNGSVRVVEADDEAFSQADAEVFAADDNTKILQGLLLEVHEAYAHCPRAFLFSRLWDETQIAEAKKNDANKYWVTRFAESMKEAL